MKTEWWYDDATYHRSHNSDIVLARLFVRPDGTAQLLSEGGETREFENETAASIWLCDEEYRPLDRLLDENVEEGRPSDPRIRPPDGDNIQELIPHLVIHLDPINGAQAPTQPDASTAKN